MNFNVSHSLRHVHENYKENRRAFQRQWAKFPWKSRYFKKFFVGVDFLSAICFPFSADSTDCFSKENMMYAWALRNLGHFRQALAWEEVAEPELVSANAVLEVKATDAARRVPPGALRWPFSILTGWVLPLAMKPRTVEVEELIFGLSAARVCPGEGAIAVQCKDGAAYRYFGLSSEQLWSEV